MTHKFRAWDGKKMYYPEHSDEEDFHVSCDGRILYTKEVGAEGHQMTRERSDTWKLMLQSPWHDRNGKQIYDGDILEIVDDRGVTIRVICQYGEHVRTMDSGFAVTIAGFAFVRLYDNHPTFPVLNNYAGKSDLEIIEIIGNRFENPEMI
jgi:hypothetical protein